MQKNSKKIILSLLSFMLIIVITIISINLNRSSTPLFLLDIHAEPDDDNKEKDDGEQKKENKLIDGNKEQDQTKDKDADKDKDTDKDKENGNKNDNSDFDQMDPAYRSFFPIKRIVIPEVYETIPNGQTYRFNINNPNDKVQVDEGEHKTIFTQQNLDGSWRIDYGKPRIDIHTKDAGILPDKVGQLNNLSKGKIQSWNFSELKKIGYWYKPTDWKNIEVTLVFKLLDSARSKGDQHSISIVTRSISHSQLDNEYKKSDDEPPFFCGGSSYHNNLSNDGNVRMKKEQFHIDYEWERYNPEITVGDIYNKIIGFKAIVYNVNDTAVKLETWVDTVNQGRGPYKKIHEGIDLGNWGDNMKLCGAEKEGQAITWGSPIVILKANDFKFDIYDLEIREIVPPQYMYNK
ncbi:MAG TPA: hypothetical protein VF084_04235 [Nitrososphaeraceae archaeon]